MCNLCQNRFQDQPIQASVGHASSQIIGQRPPGDELESGSGLAMNVASSPPEENAVFTPDDFLPSAPIDPWNRFSALEHDSILVAEFCGTFSLPLGLVLGLMVGGVQRRSAPSPSSSSPRARGPTSTRTPSPSGS